MVGRSPSRGYRRLSVIAWFIVPFAVWLARHSADRHHLIHAAIDEISSILVFAGKPIPNHSGTHFAFIQYRTKGSRTNDSWGIYVQNVNTGERVLLDDLSTDTWREGVVYEQIRTIGWSPDDRFFCYSRKKQKELIVAHAHGKGVAGSLQMSNSILSGTWLTTNTIVCTDGTNLFKFAEDRGRWFGPGEIRLSPAKQASDILGRADFLQRLGPTTFIWSQGNAIWRADLTTGLQTRLWTSSSEELMEFTYSEETKKLVLRLRGELGEYIGITMVDGGPAQNLVVILESSESGDFHPGQPRLINGGAGHAYLNESAHALNTPVVRLRSNDAPLVLPWRGEIKSFSVTQRKLLAITSLTNEPAGIWEYDFVSGAVKQLVSNQEYSFKFAKNQPPEQSFVTNSSMKRITYYFLAPASLPKGKRAPVVFGIMGSKERAYQWDRYAQTIVNCGYYFVMTDRRDTDQSDWAGDALTVFAHLRLNENIDPSNSYLLGISVGARPVSDLLEMHPELWRGAIYLSPGYLPKPEVFRNRRILIDIGSLDLTWGPDNGKILRFNDAVAKNGADASLFIRPGVGHNCRLLSVERERLHQLADFLVSK